jgi:hypothetical protein
VASTSTRPGGTAAQEQPELNGLNASCPSHFNKDGPSMEAGSREQSIGGLGLHASCEPRAHN